ncbi:flavodoxin family protein [Actinomyces naeslundii]|uniref:flavodoxin family protein n=1 Tax=Actinomyces naeslundii TaxID=1655 RepID=UPI00094D1F8F|nr:flavodoxin domain-containing protein [Actinomyces naeslundii]OLO86714.1 flavodoxin [Actinomyces naeslundii]OLO91653.1 flavodoxin [Actinomyces naeslundii]
MTKALIVVESYFGNTRAIAEAVAAGLIEGGVEAQVIDVSQAPSALPADLDLLVLGAPTHNRGLPTATSRAKACEQAGSGEASHGIGGWLETTAIPASTGAAAFDTVISKGWLSGSAAKATVKALQRHQGRQTASVRSFVVTASKGPLADGEKTDAHSWGRELADLASSR